MKIAMSFLYLYSYRIRKASAGLHNASLGQAMNSKFLCVNQLIIRRMAARHQPEPIFENVSGAQESIPRIPPGWESIAGP